jgi:hypothetical protein
MSNIFVPSRVTSKPLRMDIGPVFKLRPGVFGITFVFLVTFGGGFLFIFTFCKHFYEQSDDLRLCIMSVAITFPLLGWNYILAYFTTIELLLDLYNDEAERAKAVSWVAVTSTAALIYVPIFFNFIQARSLRVAIYDIFIVLSILTFTLILLKIITFYAKRKAEKINSQ